MAIDPAEIPSITAKKNDQGKDRFDLVSMHDVREEARVMGFGGRAYGDYNWREFDVETALNKYYSALMRHIEDWLGGEKAEPQKDTDTGLSHMIHVRCNASILKWFEINKPEEYKAWMKKRAGIQSTNKEK